MPEHQGRAPHADNFLLDLHHLAGPHDDLRALTTAGMPRLADVVRSTEVEPARLNSAIGS